MPKQIEPCRSCGKAPNAHFQGGYLLPPKGCRIIELSKDGSALDAWVIDRIKKAPPRKKYYSLPAARTLKLTPGTNIHGILGIVLAAGTAGITVEDITHQMQKAKPHVTAKGLAWDLHVLRQKGAIASAPIIKKK